MAIVQFLLASTSNKSGNTNFRARPPNHRFDQNKISLLSPTLKVKNSSRFNLKDDSDSPALAMLSHMPDFLALANVEESLPDS